MLLLQFEHTWTCSFWVHIAAVTRKKDAFLKNLDSNFVMVHHCGKAKSNKRSAFFHMVSGWAILLLLTKIIASKPWPWYSWALPVDFPGEVKLAICNANLPGTQTSWTCQFALCCAQPGISLKLLLRVSLCKRISLLMSHFQFHLYFSIWVGSGLLFL